jgi:phosphomannomutase
MMGRGKAEMTMPGHSQLVKAYDIRGEVPAELNGAVAAKIGALFTRLTGAGQIVVARDMRVSSPELAWAFAMGARYAGADVIDAGLGSTDYLYFASGLLGLPGAMITAGHQPAGYNGIKLCGPGAAPIGDGSGLEQIRAWLAAGDLPGPGRRHGTTTGQNLLASYAAHLNSLAGPAGTRRLTVAADAGNGMAGQTVPAVFAGLPVDLVPLYFELDGTFPHRPPDPLHPGSLADLRAAVPRHGADLGLAFGGDANRCVVTDENGQPIAPAAIAALVAAAELARHPGAAILHNAAIPPGTAQIIREHGGHPVRSRTGPPFMTAAMAAHAAVFGAEQSGHYYFKDFWGADTAMLTALRVLAVLARQDRPLSELAANFTRHAASGEISSPAAGGPATLGHVEAAYRGRAGISTDRLDGLTADLGQSRWFNLRPSSTEPLLRLNVEARDEPTMLALRDEVLALVRH